MLLSIVTFGFLTFKWRSVNVVKVIWQLNSAIVLCMTSKKWVKAFLKRRSLPQCQMLEMLGRHKLQQVQYNKHKSRPDKLHYFSSLTIKYRVYYSWLLGSTIFQVWYSDISNILKILEDTLASIVIRMNTSSENHETVAKIPGFCYISGNFINIHRNDCIFCLLFVDDKK